MNVRAASIACRGRLSKRSRVTWPIRASVMVIGGAVMDGRGIRFPKAGHAINGGLIRVGPLHPTT
jgi:hypothetical protein